MDFKVFSDYKPQGDQGRAIDELTKGLVAGEQHQAPGRISRAFERVFDWMLAGYDRGLNWVFRHQFITLMSTIVLIVLTGYLYYVIPKGFLPLQDTGFLFGELEARQSGIVIDDRSRLLRQGIGPVSLSLKQNVDRARGRAGLERGEPEL